MEQFKKAMQITWWLLSIHLKSIFHYQYSYIVDRVKVREYYENRPHPSVIVVQENCPTLRQQLKHIDLKHEVVFTIYPRKPDKSEWGFSTLNPPGLRFVNLVDLIQENKLKELLTYPRELIFVHKNLFCGSATKLDTAIEACILSYQKNSPKLVNQLQTVLTSTCPWARAKRATIFGTACVTTYASWWLFKNFFSKKV